MLISSTTQSLSNDSNYWVGKGNQKLNKAPCLLILKRNCLHNTEAYEQILLFYFGDVFCSFITYHICFHILSKTDDILWAVNTQQKLNAEILNCTTTSDD